MNRFFVACLLLAVSGFAFAHRNVWINGKPVGGAHLAELDRLSCRVVPNGSYWLNYRNGVWGYNGNPRPMGHISDQCRGGVAMNRRGPFGDYMSDGKCSFVNGVPVGRC